MPLSSNVHREFPIQVLLPAAATSLPRDSQAQAEQARAVAFERIGAQLALVPNPLMQAIDEALKPHLG